MSGKLFTDFGLSAEMLKAIARLGFEQPSPIQAETVPHLLAGRDLVGQSQTGSGKTAAFAIPAVERIDPSDRSVQVLILCNSRELAVQVSEEVHKLAYFKPGVRPLPIYGGQSYDRQISGLRSGANFVIGTPGRVMDHMGRGTLVLNKVRAVILDEADEMLNMGFRDDIEFILKAVPVQRQTVMFSATVPRPIEELIQRYTRDPVRIHIEAKAMTVPTVEQAYVEVDRRWKAEALERLIDLHDVSRGLIFCNTQRMVDELTELLNAAGYQADSIHGGMAQSQRDRVMKKFKAGALEFLVATDVAARGIDVDDIQVVFNYDLPYDGEDYVHRIGRTGRAGKSGLAITLASGREVFAIRQIERFTRSRLRRIQVPTHNEIEEARLNQLAQSVRTTLQAGDFRHYNHLIESLLEEGFDSTDLANALFHKLSGGEKEGVASGPAATGSMRRAESAPSAPAPKAGILKSAPPTPAPKPALANVGSVGAMKAVATPRAGSAAVASPTASDEKPTAGATGPMLEAEPVNEVIAAAQASLAATNASEPIPANEGTDAAVPEPLFGEAKEPLLPAAAGIPAIRVDPAPAVPPSQAVPPGPRSVAAAPMPVRKPQSPVPPMPPQRKPYTRESRPERPTFGQRPAAPHSPRPAGGFPVRPAPARDFRGPKAYPDALPGNGPVRAGAPDRAGFRPQRPHLSAPTPAPAPQRPARFAKYPVPVGSPTPAPSPVASQAAAPPPEVAAKKMRRPRTGPDMTRLWLSVGRDHQVLPGHVKGCILGETGLPSENVGAIELSERHTFVAVATEHVPAILAKLNRTHLGGQKLRARLA